MRKVGPVAACLFFSGLCALIFQTAWLRELRLIFGASTPASAAVLAIFMGGLGVGNAVLGRRADAVARQLRLYAQLEFLISVSAFASPFLIDLVRLAYVALGGQQTLGLTGATLARLLLSLLVLGLPTFLMGGTLAAAARAVTTDSDLGRHSVGLLYGLNALGAVTGAALGTFVLFEMLGTRTTLWAACALNLVVAAIAWRLSATAAVSPTVPAVKPPGRSELAKPPLGATTLASPALLYAAAGVVGFAFFLMELIWYRMLTPLLGGSTFTFGLILAVALAGIGVGGALYPYLFRRRTPTLYDLSLSCGLEALAMAFPLALGDRLAVFAAVLQDLTWFGFPGQVAGWTALALVVIFPAALVSGVQFPLLIALVGQAEKELGKQVGNAFAWNTVGAVAGSLAGGFGLLPLLTAPGAWSLVVSGLAVLAGLILIEACRQRWRLGGCVSAAAVALAAMLCLLAVGPTAVWRHSGIGAGRAQLPASATPNALRDWQNRIRRMTVWEADGTESSVALLAGHSYSFYVNGKSDGNAREDANTQIMLGMLGAILHEEAKQAAVVGLGSGESAGWLAATPGIERVDVIELEPAIDEVARRCAPLNHDVLNLPNVRRIYNDAREVLLTTPDRYDLIVSEPSNPFRAGIASLYTREFYAAVRRRLNQSGLFVQWLQAYEVDGKTVRTVLATLQDAFGHVEVWRSSGTDMLLVCSDKPLVYDVAKVRKRLAMPHVRSALKLAWHTDSLEGLFGFFVANEKLAAEVARHEPARNTDDHSVLEFGFARHVGRAVGFSVEVLLAEAAARGMHQPDLVGGSIDWDRADAERRAYLVISEHNHLLAAFPPQTTGQRLRAQPIDLVAAGDSRGAIAKWQEAPLQSLSASELLLFAAASADVADEQAAELIEQVRLFHRLEADALDALLLQRQGKPKEAAEKLIGLFHTLRSDPTPHWFVMQPCFRLAVQVAHAAPETTSFLFDALGSPFSVMYAEELRLSTAANLLGPLEPKLAARALGLFEPHIPWKKEFLQFRAKVYRSAGHPLTQQADAELAEFLRHDSDNDVLPKSSATSP